MPVEQTVWWLVTAAVGALAGIALALARRQLSLIDESLRQLRAELAEQRAELASLRREVVEVTREHEGRIARLEAKANGAMFPRPGV